MKRIITSGIICLLFVVAAVAQDKNYWLNMRFREVKKIANLARK